ncbi:MAG: glycoside hydrolase family 99-like domain-containing protein [Prolixibacteraceae bacterium]|jgi:lipopolysaccharide biosynthesis protein|nr:glycoside hydrolase family 99-like domain-containing protein [Prolixibacteraceae bacterium]
MDHRTLAIYLPQFHTIPENDKAWGKGFTEWTNVRKAKPLFKGHYQPHIPHEDVGYYDLSDPKVLVRQVAMAKEYGIYGFAFYHYWFNGKRLLETPLDNMLKTGKPLFPFCYIWANENWTRKWDGEDNQVIIKQNYSFIDDRQHIIFLCENVFSNKNYITIDGKHLFIVYKPYLFPDPLETTKIFRSVAAQYGIQLYLCHMVFGYRKEWQNPLEGFDAVIDFEPFGIRRNDIFQEIALSRQNNLKITHKALIYLFKRIFKKEKIFSAQYNQLHYQHMVDNLKSLKDLPYKIYPSIVPGWDNTARRKNDPALILKNSTPELFEKWLKNIKRDFMPYSKEENFIFINAWNEWAEGNHLEPCQKWGIEYLEKIKKVLSNS